MTRAEVDEGVVCVCLEGCSAARAVEGSMYVEYIYSNRGEVSRSARVTRLA